METGAITLLGNLTITAGSLSTGSNLGLTVNGDVNIANGGTLTGNASAISMNSLTLGESSAGGTYNATSETTTISGYRSSTNNAIYANGAIVHNSGTFAFTDSSNYSGIEIQIESGAGSAGTYFYNLTFSGNSTYRFPYYGSNDVTVSGDLTMSGTPDIKQWRRNLIVTGDVTIGDGCVYDCEGSGVAGVSSDFTAGSLKINSGGTFKASSGTTKITGGNSSTGYSLQNAGTFTHNNGKVLFEFTPSQNWYSQCNTYYDLELKYGNNSYFMMITDQSNNAIEVLNNLTVSGGLFELYTNSDSLDVYGNTLVTGGILHANSDQDTNKLTHHGVVTMTGGEIRINDGTTTKMGGFRKLGGTLTVS